MREHREKESQKAKRNAMTEGKVERIEKQFGGKANEEAQRAREKREHRQKLL